MDWNAREFAGPLAAVCAPITAALRPVGAALPVATASDRSIWGAGGAVDEHTVAPIVERSRRERDEPWPQPLASTAARVHRDGDRDTYEQTVFARQRRLSRAVVAAAATLDDGDLDSVADGVWLLAEQSSWCWPAHDDTRERSGSVLASVDAPFLDLGAGEVVAQLAWTDHVLGAQLDDRYPGLRARIRLEAQRRVFTPFLERRDWHWIGLDGHVHNWNPWIHGNVLVAALALSDDAETRELLVGLAAQGIDRYVAALPADGAIDEGYAYWWNGACRALEALDVLAYATDGAWDAAPAVPALRETVAFPRRSHLGGAWYVNLADGPARPPVDQPWHALHRAARAIGDTAAQRHAAAQRTTQRLAGRPAVTEAEGLGRLLRGITDPLWISAEDELGDRLEDWLERDVWMPSTEVLVTRTGSGTSGGLTLVAKGGHNGENHNHNDVGSFIVAADGVPVIVDAGRPTYTAQTFGPRRYEIWTMQSDWHNVPAPAGASQRAGAQHAAGDVRVALGDEAGALDLELAGAYPPGTIDSWHRRIELDRSTGRVHIDDRFARPEAPADAPTDASADAPAVAPSLVRLIVAGSVTLHAGGAIVRPLEKARTVRLSWPLEAAVATRVQPLDDPMLSDVWGAELTRIDITVTARDEIRVTIELEQNEDTRP